MKNALLGAAAALILVMLLGVAYTSSTPPRTGEYYMLDVHQVAKGFGAGRVCLDGEAYYFIISRDTGLDTHATGKACPEESQ